MTRDPRLRPIALAYATTSFSKIATAAVQLLALPVVATSLGSERFGVMLVLASFASLLTIPAQGLPSSASFAISRARENGGPEQVRREYWSIAALSLAIGAMVIGVAALAHWLADPVWLIGPGASAFLPELDLAFAAFAAHAAFLCFFAFAEGARAAYQENHVTNLFAMAASITVLGAVALSWAFAPEIGTFYFAIFAVPPLFQAGNLLFFHLKRRRELGPPLLSKRTLLQNCRRSVDYGTAQTGISLYLHGTVYLAAQFIGLSAGAVVGGMVRLFVIAQSTLNSFLTPILPTLSRGAAAGDNAWVRKALPVALAGIGAAMLIFAVIVAFAGEFILNLWLRLEAPQQLFLFPLFALMAFCYLAANVQNLTLIALGDGTWGAWRIFMSGSVGTMGGAIAMQFGGLSALVATQGIMMLLIAVAPLAGRLSGHHDCSVQTAAKALQRRLQNLKF